MATILLKAAGAFLGGLFGPIGATIGTAAGALVGYVADQALLQGSKHIHGPRLTGARPLNAEEGAPIPRLYGTARLGATIIWATRFEEARQTRRQGGKGGGPKVTTYSYFANAAFALCEGEIAGIRRVWADGNEIDRTQFEIRVHTGEESQPVDPLIEAKQGVGNTPAYRGVAYVVIERFPLADYGNRIPQFQFEVLRPVGSLNARIKAVALIPGSTEFGLSPARVRRSASFLDAFGGIAPAPIPGAATTENRNVLFASSDLIASLDELQMLCPNLEHVALVTVWFGNDLRAANCQVRPMVTDKAASAASSVWSVSGETTVTAVEVSKHGSSPAYGGTPSDQSVIDAISELKARGLKVTLYPFVMMDVPGDNTLPDPYGAAAQAAYPWRGRISCDPAPGLVGTADKTSAAGSQVGAFCGNVLPGDFQQQAGSVLYNGSSSDWGYRRLILHYANLAAVAGGVEAFLLGSELRGLTTLRDDTNAFPFVDQLCQLAGEVKTVLGTGTAVTYGADWSEYFGHQPADGTGDVYFHLDKLWADPAIGAVGIDNYLPLSDWCDADYGAEHPDGARGPYDLVALQAGISGGEYFDWYYASQADRENRIRTSITDGAYSKPWVFRAKDLKGWWENQHFDRVGGVEAGQPTAWVPRSKPIWQTELGCAAIDKGPNQPNVFGDPKSSENATPYFSNGGRSDLAQRRFIEAHFRHWDEMDAGFAEDNNPVSPVYSGRMVDFSRTYLWAWDARPFPAFPLNTQLWSDGENWLAGHWLNGRLSSVALGDLINAILADHGLYAAETELADGFLAGYVSADPDSARATLEPLIDIFGLAARERVDGLEFFNEYQPPQIKADPGDLVSMGEEPVIAAQRSPDHDLPDELMLHFRDPMREHQAVVARQTNILPADGRQHQSIALPAVLEKGQADALAADWLKRKWVERDTVRFRLPPSARDYSPGSVISLPHCATDSEFIITATDDGLTRQVEARRLNRIAPTPDRASLPGSASAVLSEASKPLALFLDLPMTSAGRQPQEQMRVAAWGMPWRTQIVSASPEDTGFEDRAQIHQSAVIGVLETDLLPSFSGRTDHAGSINIHLIDGEFSGASHLQVLNGANALAVIANNGVWEILQFENAVETAQSSWRLTGLLRGQLGTEDAASVGSPTGAYTVLLDDTITPAGLADSEIGLSLNWRVAPSGLLLDSDLFSSWSGIGGIRALMPLSPVHLRGQKTAIGDLAFSWVRRGRLDADSWLSADIPLGEETESYILRVLRLDGTLVREATVASPGWTYPVADIVADFPSPAEFDVGVSQLSTTVGEGIAATARFSTG